jgi:hypothetical protein
VLTSFWCSVEQKYKSIPACEQALQRIVEGAPQTQHFFSCACELMASKRVLLAVGSGVDEEFVDICRR